jgi:Protein of unknown function (DUF3684)
MDLNKLREQAISANVESEAVTVNTRALIDKVLARYSGEWTTLRELIQNAADASASKVVIRFETFPNPNIPLPSQADDSALLNHTITHHTLHRLVVSNDGAHFAESDWARLKRIAEGNPDETKIGAFGVGFYSVFADCEEPFVISGRKTMAFFWKGNSLFTKYGKLPDDQAKAQDTCFVLNFRASTTPIPNLMSICQFLATSLTFVGLQGIELWVDNWNILNLQKKAAPELIAQIPSGINTTTKGGIMTINGITHQSTQIDAKWMNIIARPAYKEEPVEAPKEEENPMVFVRSFFTKIATSSARKAKAEKVAAVERQMHGNLHEISQGSVFLRISTVKIAPKVTSSFAAELERATKKPPPKQTKIAILTASYEETMASKSNSLGLTAEHAEALFSSVLPTKNGKIFIGFPTAQTTGMLCHVSAPSVIPTVERENIDLNARWVRDWNAELLRAAGIACRLSYTSTFDDLNRKLTSDPKPEQITAAIPEATHIFKQYFATESTPSYNVGNLIEEGFWECSKTSTIAVLSTKGVLRSDKVRVVSESLGFLEDVPVIPPQLAKDAEDFVRRLYERKLIHDLTISDVRRELERRPLTGTRVTEFLDWLGKQSRPQTFDAATIASLLQSAVAVISDPNESSKDQIIMFSQVKTFVSGNRVPPSMPVPPTTVPFQISKTFDAETLTSFGWHDLDIFDWVLFLLNRDNGLPKEHKMEFTPLFAASVLVTVSRHWDQINTASRSKLTELFSKRHVVPTKLGMRCAPDAYFASVTLFDDLPNVIPELKVKEKVLVAWGVRKTIEMSLVLERLMKTSSDGEQPKWRFIDLIRYLVAIQNDIPSKDIERLRQAPICPVEAPSKIPGIKGQGDKLVSIGQVYEPVEAMRLLDFPVLFWPDNYTPSSAEGKFLKRLGIKSHPSGSDVVARIWRAGQIKDINMYNTALNYYINYYEQNGYSRDPKANYQALPLIQVEGKPFPHLIAPMSCYINSNASVLGYPIMQQSLAAHGDKFGVKRDPDIKSCANSVVGNPPVTPADATRIFEYFASRLNEITPQISEQLGSAQIVPVASKTQKGVTRLSPPNMCFLGDPSDYGDIFDFVDFGQTANSFLIRVGSKLEPSTSELAKMVRDHPTRILDSLGEKSYTSLLRRLAEHIKVLKGDKKLWLQLQQAPFLLGFKEVQVRDRSARDSKQENDLDEFQSVWEYSLHKPSEIVIVDSFKEFALFREHLITAPQEDSLESFYASLGVPMLSAVLLTDERLGSARRDQTGSLRMKKLLTERTRLFLHEYASDKIVNDFKWLDKNLNIMVVEAITVTTRLKTHPNVKPYREEKTALFAKGRTITLYITPNPDLFEVSSVVVPLLLRRPKQHDILALEMVLASDLHRLRSKGYNIDRILRQEATAKRVAEEDRLKRQRQEEERQETVRRDREKHRTDTPIKAIAPPPAYDDSKDSVQGMPGAFEHSPPQQHARPPSPPPLPPKDPLVDVDDHQPPTQRPRNFLDQVRNWGGTLGQGIGASAQNLVRPPVSEPQGPQGPQDIVQTERDVGRNLASALGSCQPHRSNMLFNPPTTTQVDQAQGSYCDSTPMSDLQYFASAGSKERLRVYFPRQFTPDEAKRFWAGKQSGIAMFSIFLANLVSVFGEGALKIETLHIFAGGGVDSKTIAFNSQGALFFNYDYFEKLHLPGLQNQNNTSAIEALSFWYVTVCHELAHNLVKEHSAGHSYYTESFVSHYFARALDKAAQFRR